MGHKEGGHGSVHAVYSRRRIVIWGRRLAHCASTSEAQKLMQHEGPFSGCNLPLIKKSDAEQRQGAWLGVDALLRSQRSNADLNCVAVSGNDTRSNIYFKKSRVL